VNPGAAASSFSGIDNGFSRLHFKPFSKPHWSRVRIADIDFHCIALTLDEALLAVPSDFEVV
jgi:hypothetical protein